MNGRRQRAERLVGADVGRSLFAADVLLPSGEREDEAALSCSVNGLPCKSPGHLANEPIARGDDACERAAVTGRQAETLRFHRDDIGLSRWLYGTEGNAFSNGYDQKRTDGVSYIGNFCISLENSKKVRRLQHNGGYVIFQRSL